MGNILAIHSPQNDEGEHNWGGTKNAADSNFSRFLNNVLINADDTTLKRGCCLGIVGSKNDRDGFGDDHGLQIPIKNIGYTGGVKGESTLLTNDKKINKIINNLTVKPEFKAVLDPKNSIIKRVVFDTVNEKQCKMGTKTYKGVDDMTDVSETNHCDDLYENFCMDQVKDFCIITGSDGKPKYDTTDPRCKATNNEGEYLFPTSKVPSKKNAAHMYPEDCSCVNGIFGTSYNANQYNLFTNPTKSNISLIHPLLYDTACTEKAGPKRQAYATQQHRQQYAKDLVICNNNIDIKAVGNVGLINVDNIKQTNNCSSGDSKTDEYVRPPTIPEPITESITEPSSTATTTTTPTEPLPTATTTAPTKPLSTKSSSIEEEDDNTSYYIIGGVSCFILIMLILMMVMMMM